MGTLHLKLVIESTDDPFNIHGEVIACRVAHIRRQLKLYRQGVNLRGLPSG